MSFHQIESIGELASLKGLRELNLRTNPVSVGDLGAISDLLPRLQWLGISVQSQDEDLTWLSELHRAEHIGIDGLNATNRVIEELVKVARLGHLRSLYLIDVGIDSLEPLVPYAEQFDALVLRSVGRGALDGLTSFTNVRMIQVMGSSVEDLERVPVLDDVYYFYIHDTRVSELLRLSRVVNVIDVDLSDNMLVDISPIRDLQMMKNLSLAGNHSLSDLSLLQRLYNLEVLDVSKCDIEDVQPLVELVSLNRSRIKQIDLSGNPDVCEHDSLVELQTICDARSVQLWTTCSK